MSFNNSQLYPNCDILIHKNDVQDLGFDKTKTIGEMIDLAIMHGCNIIVKNGKGKWYLKGKGMDIEVLKDEIEKNTGKYPRRMCYLLI